jgi:hypothetical protein
VLRHDVPDREPLRRLVLGVREELREPFGRSLGEDRFDERGLTEEA